MLDTSTLPLLQEALNNLDSGFDSLPGFTPELDAAELGRVLNLVAERLKDNYPYPHPLYAGQMLKPPHAVARLAYMLALYLNPNNHALDGGRASSAMEREGVAEIARMYGWETHLGHLCGGGTMANLEALWVAGQQHRGETIVASNQAHYTHQRICGVLGLPYESIATDSAARMDLRSLESRLREGGVGTVVATMGTTATGAVDPLPRILELQGEYGFRIHCDAAYGGYYVLAGSLQPAATAAFQAMTHADSIAIDPHKHGLQPYGCGCILFRDPGVGMLYKHDSPYTYFSSAELHLGEITLECSRAGASAVALWATQQLFPLIADGRFSAGLDRCRSAALDLYARICADNRFLVGPPPELDIVVWAPAGRTASEISRLSRLLFEEAARQDLHLALANLPIALFVDRWPVEFDQPAVTCLRSVTMKPEHAEWMETIWEALSNAMDLLQR